MSLSAEDPAKVDASALSVLVVGEGASESYGSTNYKWDERYPLIVEALEAAGVRVDVKTAAEAKAMWSFNSEDPMFGGCKTADLLRMSMVEAPWGQVTQPDTITRRTHAPDDPTCTQHQVSALQ